MFFLMKKNWPIWFFSQAQTALPKVGTNVHDDSSIGIWCDKLTMPGGVFTDSFRSALCRHPPPFTARARGSYQGMRKFHALTMKMMKLFGSIWKTSLHDFLPLALRICTIAWICTSDDLKQLYTGHDGTGMIKTLKRGLSQRSAF